jgi:hypothetical protein
MSIIGAGVGSGSGAGVAGAVVLDGSRGAIGDTAGISWRVGAALGAMPIAGRSGTEGAGPIDALDTGGVDDAVEVGGKRRGGVGGNVGRPNASVLLRPADAGCPNVGVCVRPSGSVAAGGGEGGRES